MLLAAADVIAIAHHLRVAGAAAAGQLAAPATDQAAQQVLVLDVAPRALLVHDQDLLHSGELLRADDGRHRNLDPFLRGPGASAFPAADGSERRPAPLGAHGPGLPARRQAHIGRVGQDPPHRAGVPMRPPHRGGHAPLSQATRQGIQADAARRVALKYLLDDRRLRRLELHAGRVTRPLGVEPVAVHPVRPGQQLPTLQLRQPPTPHAVSDQGPLVFRNRPPDLQDQLLVRIVGAQRSIDEVDATATALQLLQHDHLVDVVARQPVRCRHEDQVEGGVGRLIAQGIQPGAVELGPAAAVVTKDVLLRYAPARLLGDKGLQTAHLLLDGLSLLLALGRDSDVERDAHPSAPLALVRWSQPSAGGVGTLHPIAAAHPGRERIRGVPATAVAWPLPPADWVSPGKLATPASAAATVAATTSAATAGGGSDRICRLRSDHRNGVLPAVWLLSGDAHRRR